MANRKGVDSTMEGRRDAKKRGRSFLDLADENIDSDGSFSDDDANEQHHDNASASSEEEEIDLAAKKVRMAREYLERIGKDDEDSSDESGSEDDEEAGEEDRLSRKLRDRRMEQTGTLETTLAEKISQNVETMEQSISSQTMSASKVDESAEAQARAWVASGQVSLWRGHDLTPTCVALQNDGSHALSGSKDHSVLLWDVETNKKLSLLRPHWKKESSSVSRTDGQVLSVACSDDGRYAAVGCRDAVVRVYDIRANKGGAKSELPVNLIKEFRGHKGAITSLCFQSNSPQLFSASDDRIIKSYNLTEMVQLETLYGHQLGVTGIDCYQKERPVSVGRDRTARAWKLAEDTHMIYRGGSLLQPAEAVSIVKDDWFLTGHEDGQLSLWSTEKKKPLFSWEEAHGKGDHDINRSVVSVAALRRSDLAMSGSFEGYLRLWRIRTGASKADGRDLSHVAKVPIHGYINGIAIGPHAKFALLAVGNEHRVGRWNTVPRARNRLAFVDLSSPSDSSSESSSDEESSSE